MAFGSCTPPWIHSISQWVLVRVNSILYKLDGAMFYFTSRESEYIATMETDDNATEREHASRRVNNETDTCAGRCANNSVRRINECF